MPCGGFPGNWSIAAKRWHTFCQGPPVDCPSGSAVLKYLARYVVGSAISDQRIISDDGENVTIRAKDYRTGIDGPLVLTGEEFVGRYLLHILPRGMHRVRYGGLFTTRHRQEKLAHCRKLLGAPEEPAASETDETAEDPFDFDEAEDQPTRQAPICPRCLMPGMGSMGRHTRAETYHLLAQLTHFWQSIATVLMVLPLPSRSVCQLPLSLDNVAWTVTTLEIEVTTSQRGELPKPDT